MITRWVENPTPQQHAIRSPSSDATCGCCDTCESNCHLCYAKCGSCGTYFIFCLLPGSYPTGVLSIYAETCNVLEYGGTGADNIAVYAVRDYPDCTPAPAGK